MIETMSVVDATEIKMRSILLIGDIDVNEKIVTMTIVTDMSADNDVKNEELDETSESDENEESSESGTGMNTWRTHSTHLLPTTTRNLVNSKTRIDPRPRGPPPKTKAKKKKKLNPTPTASYPN